MRLLVTARWASLILAPTAILLAACHHHHDHPHEADGTEEHPVEVVTHWTDRTELFMEYPVLVAGESGRWAIHVTDLLDFSPVSEGEAVVRLVAAGGGAVEFRGAPSRPGIFGVDVEVERPGDYAMTLRVEAPGLEALHDLGTVSVLAHGAKPLGGEAEEAESISFLKEQQWTLEFGTEPVVVRDLQGSVTVPATAEARAGGDALLTAPVSGRVDPASRVPVPGTRVASGDVLLRILPRSDDLHDDAGELRAVMIEAEQDHALAAQEYERVARLVEDGILASRRLACLLYTSDAADD